MKNVFILNVLVTGFWLMISNKTALSKNICEIVEHRKISIDLLHLKYGERTTASLHGATRCDCAKSFIQASCIIVHVL